MPQVEACVFRPTIEGLAYLWVEIFGRPGRPLAAALGVQSSAIPKAVRRGSREARYWSRLLEGG